VWGVYLFCVGYPITCVALVLSHAPYIPFCPFYLATGSPCPFCGLSRSIGHLLTGEFSQSWNFNKLAIPVLIFLGVSAYSQRMRRTTPVCERIR
jgi:hypothetical protein